MYGLTHRHRPRDFGTEHLVRRFRGYQEVGLNNYVPLYDYVPADDGQRDTDGDTGPVTKSATRTGPRRGPHPHAVAMAGSGAPYGKRIFPADDEDERKTGEKGTVEHKYITD